jgi:metallophosphoesterase (TIGR00282 family)
VRILHIGDIVGRPGRRIVRKALPGLVRRERIDFVIANGENAAGGSGITPDNFQELIAAGVHCVTLGDHIFRQKQIVSILEGDSRILKPANYPAETPGRGWTILQTADHIKVAVVSLLGRVFMRPVDCPWLAMDRVLQQIGDQVNVICVDFHAEATSDKQLMGRYLDGRVTSVLGTHTHVTTADEEIFPGGTAFQCDIGMTGPYHSILGRDIESVLLTTRTFLPTVFDVAKGDDRLHATMVDVDATTGKAQAIRRIVLREEDLAALA